MKILVVRVLFTKCGIVDTSLTEAGSVMGIRNSEFEHAWGRKQ
jgi:hypothetical protein